MKRVIKIKAHLRRGRPVRTHQRRIVIEDEEEGKPYYIPEPFGLPFELTPAGKFKRLGKKRD